MGRVVLAWVDNLLVVSRVWLWVAVQLVAYPIIEFKKFKLQNRMIDNYIMYVQGAQQNVQYYGLAVALP